MSDAAPIILAPFANERMREWPTANFRQLIDCGLEDGRTFTVLGAMPQRALADDLVRRYPADLVVNACGVLSWGQAQERIKAAAFVVANNSGIAHLAAALDVWVLCVFGAKHSWIEWMPRGRKVVTLVRPPACSPCDSSYCPNDLTCLSGIDGQFAYAAIKRATADGLATATS